MKNFQLCHSHNPEVVIMQLGKVDQDTFIMDFRSVSNNVLQFWHILLYLFVILGTLEVSFSFLTTDYVPGIPYQHSRPSGSHYPASTASWRANRRSDHREKMTHLQPPIWVKTWLMKIADDVSVADHGTAVSCAAVVTFYNFSTNLWWMMVDQNILLIRNKVLHRSIKHWLF